MKKNKNCIAPKKDKNKGNAADVVTDEIQVALLLSIDNPIDSWV